MNLKNERYKIKTFTLELREPLPQERDKLCDPSAVDKIARQIFAGLDADQEHFIVLALDIKNQINGYKIITSGAPDRCAIYPWVVFRAILFLGGIGFACIHNHPSGDTEPSSEDIVLTKTLVEGSKILGLTLHDHIILGNNKFLSMKTQGII